MKLIRFILLCILFHPSLSHAQTQETPKNELLDLWESCYARDSLGRDHRIGYSHVFTEKVMNNGIIGVRCTRELRLTFKRDGQLSQLRADVGCEESEAGTITATFMKHWIGTNQSLDMKGLVTPDGKHLKLSITSSKKVDREIPWSDKIISTRKELSIYKLKNIRPGEKFTYQIFEPSIAYTVNINVVVKGEEAVVPPQGGKRTLLRVEAIPEKIQNVQLPAAINWCDPKTLEVVLSQIDMPDLGLLTFQRSTKQVATGPLGDVPDLMKQQAIRLNERLSGDVHGLRSITFRLTPKKGVNASELLKSDDRQVMKERTDGSLELIITAIRQPVKKDKMAPVAKEYTESNHFINSDDAEVQALARKAIGTLKNPWDQARAIERWVRSNMKVANYTEALATADHVAKTLSGDCTEYSMLTAAMCRAVGIPSRTAIGLIYVDSPSFGGPALAFHMWTEVYIEGQWLGLDATLGRGMVGPGHIKITDHSWYNVSSVKPLLPVMGFIMAKPKIEILEAAKEPR